MIVEPGIEQDTFKFLLEEYLAQINRNDALQKIRAKAWDHFLALGLPTRQTEVYRYVKLRNLFSQNYQLANEISIKHEEIASSIYPECRQSVLVFVNGYFAPTLSNTSALPSKVVTSSLTDAIRTYGMFLNNFWAKAIKEETDPFAALNTALHPNGIFIYIPPKTVVETPIQILNVISGNNQLLLPHLSVFVGAQSQINVISSQKVLSSSGYFVNQVTEIMLEEDSHVHYTQALCGEHPASWHLDAFRATLKQNATLKTVAVTEGSATVRNDYRILLTGENAEALLNGVLMLSDKREAHTNIFMDHQAPNCHSYQLFKSVLKDFSRSSFEGKIMVRQLAQKTDAFQLNNNLLLSDHAHADSKPNLEVFADDVKASHGTTMGQLDEDQLFYMKTRGFPDHEAKNLLIFGFCEQVIERINIKSLQNEITQRARGYLTKGDNG
ncbi:MAG: Fe-S cluster assembly protein SufD [Parachlamydiaceae bacterium]|nr:Fe-S cluster assembly protein SufD [Parachlamydiaceae bacterium]